MLSVAEFVWEFQSLSTYSSLLTKNIHVMCLIFPGHYGGSATLLCSIDSLIPFTVRWYREGSPISPQQYFRYEYNTLHKFFRSRFFCCKILMNAGEVYSSFSCLVLKKWQVVKNTENLAH